MTVSTTYLLRVLRVVGEKLEAEGRYRDAALITRITSALSSSSDPESELDRLLSSDGAEQVALALMWMQSRDRNGMNGLRNDVIDYDVENLWRSLGEAPDEADEDEAATDAGPSLRDQLTGFSRIVADVERRIRLEGPTEDLFWRLRNEVDPLRFSAVREASQDVSSYCDGLDLFLGYVLEHRLFADPRAIALITSSNLTLQTIIGGGIPEDRRSLEQAIEILRKPALLFEHRNEKE